MALRILGRLKTTVAIGPSCCTRMSALGLTVVQCSRGTRVPALAQAARGWWRWEELNLRHGAYETPALPLSYTAGWPGRPRSERSVPHDAETQPAWRPNTSAACRRRAASVVSDGLASRSSREHRGDQQRIGEPASPPTAHVARH